MKNKFAKVKTVLKEYEIYFVILIVSIAIGNLIDIITRIPIGLILGETSDLWGFIIGNIGTIIAMFVLSFKKGYRCRKLEYKKMLLNTIFLLVLQLVVALTIGHTVYISGPSVFLATVVSGITDFRSEILNMYETFFMVVIFLFNYAPAIILGQYFGFKKRKKDFPKNKD